MNLVLRARGGTRPSDRESSPAGFLTYRFDPLGYSGKGGG